MIKNSFKRCIQRPTITWDFRSFPHLHFTYKRYSVCFRKKHVVSKRFNCLVVVTGEPVLTRCHPIRRRRCDNIIVLIRCGNLEWMCRVSKSVHRRLKSESFCNMSVLKGKETHPLLNIIENKVYGYVIMSKEQTVKWSKDLYGDRSVVYFPTSDIWVTNSLTIWD